LYLLQANITRSKQDAIEQLKKFEQELQQDSSKDKFASLASVHSYVSLCLSPTLSIKH